MYTFYNNDQEFDKLRIFDFPILYQGPDTEPASEALLGGITKFEGPQNRFPLKGTSGSPIIGKINGKATLIGILSGAGITECAFCWDLAYEKLKAGENIDRVST